MDFKPFFEQLRQENAEQAAANEKKRKDKLDCEFKEICAQIRDGGGRLVRLGRHTSEEAIKALKSAGCEVKTLWTESYMTNSTVVDGYEVTMPK